MGEENDEKEEKDKKEEDRREEVVEGKGRRAEDNVEVGKEGKREAHR